MPMNFLGKVLFPRDAAWQRKKQAKILVWVVVTAMVFGAGVAAIILYQNSHR